MMGAFNAGPINGPAFFQSIAETYPSLVAAILGRLQAECGTLFGSTDSAPKFFADFASGVSLPYCVITDESGEASAESSDGVAIYHEQINVAFTVYASSATSARTLRKAVVTALADAPLVNDDVTVLEFRPSKFSKSPTPNVGPRTPVVFQRTVEFLGQIREL